jgi:hypothetical protein
MDVFVAASTELGIPFFPIMLLDAQNMSMGGVAWNTGVYGLCSATIPRQETSLTFAFQMMENFGIPYLVTKLPR